MVDTCNIHGINNSYIPRRDIFQRFNIQFSQLESNLQILMTKVGQGMVKHGVASNLRPYIMQIVQIEKPLEISRNTVCLFVYILSQKALPETTNY